MILEMSLDDVPKKVQYIVLDSNFVNGTNNTFSLDLTLKSNTHVEDMSRVLGIKLVDFYITQIGDNIRDLFHEFEQIENTTKKSSKSFRNLSDVMTME